MRLLAWPAAIALAAAGAFLVARQQAQGPGEAVVAPAGGLPETPDYHALLVSPDDPERVLLGTHAGLFETVDGGATWTEAGLVGRDAMNLVRTPDGAVWVAGHEVLARSDDGGATWSDVRPEGLPGLDVHGFAADPGRAGRLFAAVAGKGLYCSDDGGRTFVLVSSEVGADVFGLAVLPGGRLLAGDARRGLLASDDGGAGWRPVDELAAAGLAVGVRHGTVLAAGAGERVSGVLRSLDEGASWQAVLPIPQGAGPVAWSESDPAVAYAIGFDGRLYRSDDRGATWRVVGARRSTP